MSSNCLQFHVLYVMMNLLPYLVMRQFFKLFRVLCL